MEQPIVQTLSTRIFEAGVEGLEDTSDKRDTSEKKETNDNRDTSDKKEMWDMQYMSGMRDLRDMQRWFLKIQGVPKTRWKA